ncbi:IS1182-like element ISBuce1 family transposase [Burkholderia vietnamiensis]|uniref:Transposase, IS4 family n=2 Tax=Burkholderia TaxID=32008 RepID=A4JUZ3_BURVG|nr:MULTISPECIES: IS1182-like element ISBuce1 family transposase [Burkholderia]ABO60096.1 transposase, IS4 family [Burkholderia vietnamiensis G4]MDN8103619.1 IS1182-like element ISBuce1 family transposase [Burkholderia multivorans]HDR9763808.1 IS1182-like element ISBuce1 family transposase [Burkholderia cepacia ATCC 25416]AXK68249.1 IS1182-like element ISBuce1 family transposase [Burkholderia sp. IDO3]MBR7917035.1 IS1182-like element ISBuce1 family transposase [Burkholderia vietnamiensis]
MRGTDTFTESLFTMRKLEDFVPARHPLREIRKTANAALDKLGPTLTGMYAAEVKGGRPSIAPEKLLRAMLLQVLFSVRSERQLMEQVHYNLLFRWFIGLSMDDAVWVPTVFTKNRERLIKHDAVIKFFNEVVDIAHKRDLLSGEHFSVDGTLIQAWAGHKSFVPKDDKPDADGGGAPAGDFKGQRRSNDTHESKSDGDARLYRKGNTASELRYMGHTLSDNRHGLIASAMVTQADGFAEREAAKAMISDARQALGDDEREITLGADKGYDAKEFIDACMSMKVTPHVAQNTSGRKSAVPDEIAQTQGYATSQRKRKLIEQGFGWAKTVGGIRQVMVRGLERVDQMFVLTMAAYNLVRMRSLGQVRLQAAQ